MEFFTSRQAELEDERRRKGKVLEDGEYARFDIMMRDSSSGATFLMDGKEGSIDDRLRDQIARLAKDRGLKPSEYLAQLKPTELEHLIKTVASGFVASAGASGVANAFSMDASLADAEASFILRKAELRDQRRNAWKTAGNSLSASDGATARDAALASDPETAFAQQQARLRDERQRAWMNPADKLDQGR